VRSDGGCTKKRRRGACIQSVSLQSSRSLRPPKPAFRSWRCLVALPPEHTMLSNTPRAAPNHSDVYTFWRAFFRPAQMGDNRCRNILPRVPHPSAALPHAAVFHPSSLIGTSPLVHAVIHPHIPYTLHRARRRSSVHFPFPIPTRHPTAHTTPCTSLLCPFALHHHLLHLPRPRHHRPLPPLPPKLTRPIRTARHLRRKPPLSRRTMPRPGLAVRIWRLKPLRRRRVAPLPHRPGTVALRQLRTVLRRRGAVL